MKSQTQEQWNVYPLLTKEQFEAARQAGVDPLSAQLLFNRGLQTVEEMARFLQADYATTYDPLTLIDMPRAIERIQRAITQHEHITVYGDYDADGVTSSSLLLRALRTLMPPKATLDYYIPHRLHDGCGLNISAIDTLKLRGTQLIITTDCASSDVEQVAYAKEQGIDIIITDHHHPPTRLPDACAIINPWRPECTYGERYLCGAGIAFKLAQALYRAYNRSIEEEIALLDLVAIGTIADIAPLLGENHLFVRLGIEQLNKTSKPGLLALIHNASLRSGRIRERDIAYGLAPRINAAGRMQDAGLAFELLATDNWEEAKAHANALEQLNLARQQETEELMKNVREQAQSQPTKPIILVSGDDWHEGIIGLVAGKLAEEIDKPVLVLSNDKATQLSRGSARSRKHFNIIEALRDFADRLERYGGHAQAAGFTIRSERIEELHEHLLTWPGNSKAVLPTFTEGTNITDQTGLVTEAEQNPQPNIQPRMVDLAFTRMEKINYELYRQIQRLSPFGAGNPEPIFKMEGLRLLDMWLSGVNKQNLRLRLGASQGTAQQVGTLIRGAGQRSSFKDVKKVNIIFRLEAIENDNKQEIWLKILDVEPAEQQDSTHAP